MRWTPAGDRALTMSGLQAKGALAACSSRRLHRAAFSRLLVSRNCSANCSSTTASELRLHPSRWLFLICSGSGWTPVDGDGGGGTKGGGSTSLGRTAVLLASLLGCDSDGTLCAVC